jgi:hypothetical protein
MVDRRQSRSVSSRAHIDPGQTILEGAFEVEALGAFKPKPVPVTGLPG